MEKVLVVSPHMDDETLGVGGSILKHLAKGDEVQVCFLCHRKYGNKFDPARNQEEVDHVLRAKEVLGYHDVHFLNLEDERLDDALHKVIGPLEKVVQGYNPTIVYIPSFGDNNQDHRAAFEACMVVFRPFALEYKQLLAYEVLSSTDQSPPIAPFEFSPNYYVDITNELEKKQEAFSCYESESFPWPHPRSLKAIEVLAQKRGLESNFHAAEAFMVIRQRWY